MLEGDAKRKRRFMPKLGVRRHGGQPVVAEKIPPARQAASPSPVMSAQASSSFTVQIEY
jgi:hypothetical protein